MRFLVTGGAGFIGSNFIHHLLATDAEAQVIVVDALTYAGNLSNLKGLDGRFAFVRADISDRETMQQVFERFECDVVVNFAAESHVDRSILESSLFVQTNIVGTQVLLDLARKYKIRRFLQVSTDEVYGSLGQQGAFSEESPLAPNSPYAASKAAADLLVRACVKTHGFPAIITRCSNNYGPRQFPEKLIPLMILNSFEGRSLPVYGDGLYVRDWIYVEDHCRALAAILDRGRLGEVYNIGAEYELRNLDVVHRILEATGASLTLIKHVTDRPGHDRRYAIDASKIRGELDWQPGTTFEDGLAETVHWYKQNSAWIQNVIDGSYRDYYERMYDTRQNTLAEL